MLAVWNYARREDVEIDSSQNSPEKVDKTEQRPRGTWIFSSVGLGGLLFSLQCFLSDADTMVAYSWTGYPVKGPLPGGLHACLTILATAFGIFMSTSSPRSPVTNPLFIIFGSTAVYVMYREKNWKGYCGGLATAVFLCSLSPTLIQTASFYGKNAPAKVYGTAWLVYCLLILANIWTVAYAFVPAGWLLRERTDM